MGVYSQKSEATHKALLDQGVSPPGMERESVQPPPLSCSMTSRCCSPVWASIWGIRGFWSPLTGPTFR